MGPHGEALRPSNHQEAISRPFVELLFSTPYMAESLVFVPLTATFASFNPHEQLLATAPTMNLVLADVGSLRGKMRGPMSGSSASSAGVVVVAGVDVIVRYPGHFQFLKKTAPSFEVYVELETIRLQGLHNSCLASPRKDVYIRRAPR